MNLLLCFIINASVFSIDGLGEDVTAFRQPFLGLSRSARVEFTLCPEFNILNEDSDFRGIFWTNPFRFSIAVPVYKGLAISVGNNERFNQSFDVYLLNENLEMHLTSEGGIEEAYMTIGYQHGPIEGVLSGAYLFGNATEIWDYTIGNYNLADTFLYKYRGKIFSAGIKAYIFSCMYEGLGDVTMEKSTVDTLQLPGRLSFGIFPKIKNGTAQGIFEYIMWPREDETFSSSYRVKVGYARNRFALNYFFKPWYLSSVTEHGLQFSIHFPVQRLGWISLQTTTALRMKGSLREIKFSPEIVLRLQELFVRRKK